MISYEYEPWSVFLPPLASPWSGIRPMEEYELEVQSK